MRPLTLIVEIPALLFVVARYAEDFAAQKRANWLCRGGFSCEFGETRTQRSALL